MAQRSHRISVRLLGDVAVVREGQPVALPPSKKVRALLAYLLLREGEHTRERLSALLWDVADDRKAALRWSLNRLRSVIDDEHEQRLIATRESVRIASSTIEVDVLLVREALKAGVTQLDFERLQFLQGLFCGEFLQGHELTDFMTFRSWLVAERDELRAQQVSVLRELLRRLPDDPEHSVEFGRKLVELEPLDGVARAALVRSLAILGRTGEAQEQKRAGKRVFDEVGELCPPELLAIRSTMPPAGLPSRDLRQSSSLAVHAGPSSSDTTRLASSKARIHEESPPSRRRSQLVPLVGRDTLVGELQSQLVDKSKGSTVLLGEPGVGKSRLMLGLESWVESKGFLALYGRAHEAELGRPYGPFIDGLRRMGVEDVSANRLVEDLSGHASTERSRDALFAGVSAFFQTRARQARVYLFLDDLQWADRATVGLLSYVLRTCERDDFYVVMTVRDGELLDNAPMYRLLQLLEREGRLHSVNVPRLGEEATAELVRVSQLLGPEANIRLNEIFEKSAGNPLFALEIARNGGTAGKSLQGIVLERLSRAPESALSAVRWASVLGTEFNLETMRALVALSPPELMTIFERLEQLSILIPTDRGYSFAHDIVRSAIYVDISAPRRRMMHQRVAEVLRPEVERDPSLIAELSTHAMLAENAELAARSCLSAARHFLKIFANEQAETAARTGKHHASNLPSETRVPLEIELLEVSFAARRPKEPQQFESELEALAELALDLQKPKHARVAFTLLAYLRWEQGNWTAAKNNSKTAEIVSRAGSDEDRISAMAEAARCLALVERDLSEAEALLLEARALSARLGVESATLHDGVGLLRLHQGKLQEAAIEFDAAARTAARAGHRVLEFYTRSHTILLDIQKRDYERASLRLDALEGLAVKLREGSELPFTRALRAFCAYALGESDSRDSLLKELSELRAADAKHRLISILGRLAEIDRERGHLEWAQAEAEEALEVAALLERCTEMVLAHVTLGRIALSEGSEHGVRAHVEALGPFMPRASREAKRRAISLRKESVRRLQTRAPREAENDR